MSGSAQKLKSRIKSAKNIAQITKAMEMVSAAKMRKAQERALQSSPYAKALAEFLNMLGTRSSNEKSAHPLLQKREHPAKALVVVFTSDKGLAGSFHANIFRQISQLERRLHNRDMTVTYVVMGRKGRDFLRYTKRELAAVFDTAGDRPTTAALRPLVSYVTDEFISGHVDEVHLIFSEFVSTLVQRPTSQQLLPFALDRSVIPSEAKRREESRSETSEPTGSFAPLRSAQDDELNQPASLVPLFEPNRESLLNTLLPFAVEYMVYKTVLQNLASEHSARMMAMKNAHDNAKEVGNDLNLLYNQIRQATITQQIAEISSASMTTN